jgi:hypothetical protein
MEKRRYFMKKLIVILLLCILILPSCAKDNDIILENESLKDIEIEAPTNSNKIIYVLNTNSHKYHLRDCRFAQGIRAENRYETSDMEFIKSRGYEPCSTCIKSN